MFLKKGKKQSAIEASDSLLGMPRSMAMSGTNGSCTLEWSILANERDLPDYDFIVEMINLENQENPYEIYYVRSIFRDPVQSRISFEDSSSARFSGFPPAMPPRRMDSTPIRYLAENVIVGLLISVILVFFILFINNR